MTERLADISARIGGIRQLGSVVNALRGIAAARAQQARTQIDAVDSYARTVVAAIGRALALMPDTGPEGRHGSTRLALVLFCAEQGFAGAFSERVLDSVASDLATSELFLIGSRGVSDIAERHIVPGWTAQLPSHSPGIPALADRIVEAIYACVLSGEIARIDAVFSRRLPGHATTVERRHLFPFDTAAFPPPRDSSAPFLNLTPKALLSDLTADYLHATLCTAALHAFAAENEARMEAMAAARSHVEEELSSLQATERRVRQEEITAEIIELAAGETAGQPG